MALRFVQLYLPQCSDDDLRELLGDREALGAWRDAHFDDKLVVHLLLQAEEAEAVMDEFEDRFGSNEGFHAVVSAVEAVLPHPDEGKDDVAENEQDDDKAHGLRVSRDELYNQLNDSLGVHWAYLAMAALSALVAALGLLHDDVAAIIGAMVIAPLLGPNVAISLAVTLGDLALLRRAALTGLAGFALALAVAYCLGLALEVDPEIPAIADRTRAGLGSVGLALGAGAAGAIAYTRGMAGPVIGVMVAVALAPPLVAAGLLLGAGHYAPATGALLLTAINVICINLSGTLAFVLQGVRPRRWWEEERAKTATRSAVLLCLLLLGALVGLISLSNSDGLAKILR
ncbi:MAG: TIGR00341 family protein [Acidobacteria bacterium]|nr:TIGR00341 family protein [Acidobacteriota bacterium]